MGDQKAWKYIDSVYFIMTTILMSVINRVKDTQVVRDSLDMLTIASEAYQLYKKDLMLAQNEKVPIRKAEDLYFEAVTKVTHETPKKVTARPDYKLIAFSAENLRKARDVSEKSFNNAAKTLKNGKDMIANLACQIMKMIEVKIDYLKNNYGYLMNRSSVIMKNLRSELMYFMSHSYDFTTQVIASVLQKLSLADFAQVIFHNSKAFLLNINFYAHCLKNYTLGFLSDVNKSLNNFNFYHKTMEMLSGEFTNLRHGIDFVIGTIMKNEKSLVHLKDYTVDNVKNSFDKNLKLVQLIFGENLKLLKYFFSEMDFEVFYSPKDSFKVVEDSKTIISMLTGQRPKEQSNVIEITETIIYEEVPVQTQHQGNQHHASQHHSNQHQGNQHHASQHARHDK